MISDFAGLPEAEAETMGFSAARLQRISDIMAKAVDDQDIPGAVTVIARHGRVVHSNVAGRLDLERPEPLAMNSLFRMYSQTKPVTAVVTMTLVEEGLLWLDDPIAKWLPEFEQPQVLVPSVGGIPVPANRAITIFDLMTMTSGLPNISRTPSALWHQLEPALLGAGMLPGEETINNPEGTYEDMVLGLANVPLYAQPGSTWAYGSDFDVLSLLLERASGKPLDVLFEEQVLGPLGMKGSGFYCKKNTIQRLVTDHAWDQRGRLITRDRPQTAEKAGNGSRKLMSGNGLFGGLLCTPGDFGRFCQMLLNGGNLDGVQVLGRKTVELLTTNHIGDRSVDIAVDPSWGYGLGFGVRKGIGGSFHPGSAGTFGWGGAAGTSFFVDRAEGLWGMLFNHIFKFQEIPKAARLITRFEKMTYEALV